MRTILHYAFGVFVMLFGAYMVVECLPSELLGGADRVRIISAKLNEIGSAAWSLIQPLVQLAAIIFILQETIDRYACVRKSLGPIATADFKSLLAIIVVAAFCVATLAGVSTASQLKDVALVVIGFYFGGVATGQKKPPSDEQAGSTEKTN